MKIKKVEQLLVCLNSQIDHESHREGWVIATCPFAPWTHVSGVDNKPSFGVQTPKSGKVQIYNCFSCGEAGAFQDLVFDVREHYRKKKNVKYQIGKALEVLVADDDEEFDIDVPDYDEPVVDPEKVIPWPEFYLESFKSVFAFPEALGYLKTRQIDEETIHALNLHYDTSRMRVCFPIRDFDGQLVGLHGRAINDHPLPYYMYGHQSRRNKQPWYGEMWVDMDKPVVLVESVFDLASVYRVYRNVMCPLSAGFSNSKARRIDGAVQFITLFDYGTGGDQARDRLDKSITSPMKHLIPDKESGDPGNMGIDGIKEIFDGLL
jgi:hypothetical protein